MKIEELEIKDFKVLDQLEFEPKKINLITGRNNTGKTSLLQAINLAFNPMKITKFKRHLPYLINLHAKKSQIEALLDGKRIKINFESPNSEDIFKTLRTKSKRWFNVIVRREDIEIKKFPGSLDETIGELLEEERQKGLLSKVKGRSIKISKVNENREKSKEAIYLSLSKNGRDFLWSIIRELLRRCIEGSDFEPFTKYRFFLRLPHPELSIFEKEQQNVFFIKDPKLKGGQIKEEKETKKIHQVEKYLKEWNVCRDLERFDLPNLIFSRNKEDEVKQVPYSFMGDGFKALTGLLWQIVPEKIKHKILLIEEPENHMHPGYIHKLVKILIKFSYQKDVQLFITTHNSDFIKAFFDEDVLSDHDLKFLKENFSLLRLETAEDHLFPEFQSYSMAESKLKDTLLDLRGA